MECCPGFGLSPEWHCKTGMKRGQAWQAAMMFSYLTVIVYNLAKVQTIAEMVSILNELCKIELTALSWWRNALHALLMWYYISEQSHIYVYKHRDLPKCGSPVSHPANYSFYFKKMWLLFPNLMWFLPCDQVASIAMLIDMERNYSRGLPPVQPAPRIPVSCHLSSTLKSMLLHSTRIFCQHNKPIKAKTDL